MDMKPLKIELLATHLTQKLGVSFEDALEALQDWFVQPDPVPTNQLSFEVVALYDKGFGPECMNLPVVKVKTVSEAQAAAEELATNVFMEKFRGKVEWEEVKIRPVK
jgi:hypothetical protein